METKKEFTKKGIEEFLDWIAALEETRDELDVLHHTLKFRINILSDKEKLKAENIDEKVAEGMKAGYSVAMDRINEILSIAELGEE